MEILIVRQPVNEATLRALARAWHGDVIKGVADIRQETLALGGAWHKEAKARLIEDGSNEKDIWGFLLYPRETGLKAIEYSAHINIRPLQGNFTREITKEDIQIAIRKIVALSIPSLGL